MLEKTFHAGNIAASFGVVATAADLTFAGGAATSIGAALSGIALFKNLDRRDKQLSKSMAATMQEAMQRQSLSTGQRKLVAQLLEQFKPTEAEIAQGNMEATKVASNLCDRVRRTATDPAHQNEAIITAFGAVVEQTLGPHLNDAVGMSPQMTAVFQVLLERSEQSGRADTLRDEGITEKAIIRLAQRVAADTEDVGQAWLELQNAMDVAVRVQADGRVTSNHGDFVDEVLKRVAELSAEGEYESAGDAINEALAREEEESLARRLKLLDRGVEVALLDRDTDRAAELLVQGVSLKIELDQSPYNGIFANALAYLNEGTRNGSSLFLELASRLFLRCVDLSRTNSEKINALGNIALIEFSLGQRSASPDHLLNAAKLFQDLLELAPKESHRIVWANTQTNLGNVLRTLGEREMEPTKLFEAKTALSYSLEAFDRDGEPLDWAQSKNDLGIVYYIISVNYGQPSSLEHAIECYHDALSKFSRMRNPIHWSMVQHNLGNALSTLGELNGDSNLIDQSISAFRKALQKRDPADVPPLWAKTKHGIANSLAERGYYSKDVAILEEAKVAFSSAFTVRTLENSPRDWAGTKRSYSDFMLKYFEVTGDVEKLEVAEAAARDALQIYEIDGAQSFIHSLKSLIRRIKAYRDAL